LKILVLRPVFFQKSTKCVVPSSQTRLFCAKTWFSHRIAPSRANLVPVFSGIFKAPILPQFHGAAHKATKGTVKRPAARPVPRSLSEGERVFAEFRSSLNAETGSAVSLTPPLLSGSDFPRLAAVCRPTPAEAQSPGSAGKQEIGQRQLLFPSRCLIPNCYQDRVKPEVRIHLVPAALHNGWPPGAQAVRRRA
jgi:hypothetical protein